jgi:hypothetical protein
MSRIVSLVVTVASVIAAAVGAVVLAGRPHGGAHHAAAQRGVIPTLPGSVQIVRYQGVAGSASCTGNSCSASGSAGPQFTLPASAVKYRSVLTISFRYRANGPGATFVVHPDLFPETPNGHAVDIFPARRPVLATGGQQQSMTVTFKPALLSGSTPYGVGISPDIAHFVTSASISVTQVVYTLTAWLS